jgi:hypothetical protein
MARTKTSKDKRIRPKLRLTNEQIKARRQKLVELTNAIHAARDSSHQEAVSKTISEKHSR